MKRACILFFYDKDGIADEYNFYNLKELRTVCDYILVVINGKLAPESRDRLADVCDDMFVRKNEGFDAWAYKDGIEYIGYDGLKEYDELILTNNTVYGPLRPLKEFFAEVENVSCDFWGLQMSYGDPEEKVYLNRTLPWGCRPDAIISNFRVIRSKCLHSIEFARYWQELAPVNNYTDAVYIGELQFSYDMTNAGFVSYSLDRGEYRGASPSPTIHNAYDQISRLKIPYFRKRIFSSPLSHYTDCMNSTEPAKVLAYVKDHTDYDTDMIWENLIRTVNQYDLHHMLGLTEILPYDRSSHVTNSRIAVIFHAYYTDIFTKYIPYLESFPAGTDIYFTVGSEEKEKLFREMTAELSKKYKITFIPIENTGRDVSALLIGGRDVILNGGYDYICFMHDKKGIGARGSYECVGSAFSETCFDNTAITPDYVNNVIELFDTDPHLGIASPPPPTHAAYFRFADGDWGENYEMVCDLVKKYGFNVPIAQNKPPVAPLGTVFWFRAKAMEKLAKINWKYSDFPTEPAPPDGSLMNAIERLYSIAVQDAGYYPATIMNRQYAASEFAFYSQTMKKYHQLLSPAVGWAPSSTAFISACRSFDGTFGEVKKAKGLREPKTTSGKIFVRLSRSRFKDVAKAILPHGLWEAMRKKKCEQIGEKYYRI